MKQVGSQDKMSKQQEQKVREVVSLVNECICSDTPT